MLNCPLLLVDHCDTLPDNCILEDREACQYKLGQTCGIGYLDETRKCFSDDDPDQVGPPSYIYKKRKCCEVPCSGNILCILQMSWMIMKINFISENIYKNLKVCIFIVFQSFLCTKTKL